MRAYTAAADHYLLPGLGFWDRWGAATVKRLPLSPGDAVLDVCCGAGASALPAAQAVGPTGSVLGRRLVRPGGTLAITTWGPDWCEPASGVFWEGVREIEPTLFRAFNPWDEIITAPALASWTL